MRSAECVYRAYSGYEQMMQAEAKPPEFTISDLIDRRLQNIYGYQQQDLEELNHPRQSRGPIS